MVRCLSVPWFGAAADQQCKFFKGMVNPLGDLGYDEGALCTPQVGTT